MSGTTDGALVFTSSRQKWALVFAGSLAFVAGGVAMVESHDLVGWLGICFFGLGCLVAGAMFVKPARIRVTDQEVAFDQWWRHHTYEFKRCGEFRIWNNPFARGNKLVVFEYDGPIKHPLLYRFNRALGASSAALPETFGMPAGGLVDLLNEHRASQLGGR